MTDRFPVTFADPGDAAQLVPHLLGFVPEESLVISVMERGRIVVTGRADLTDMQPPGGVEDLIDRMWARFPDGDARLFAYTADEAAGWSVLERCEAHLPRTAGRWSLVVDGDTWQLRDGRRGRVDRAGRVATAAVLHGLTARRSRKELEQLFISAPVTRTLERQAANVQASLPPADDTAAVMAHARRLIDRNLASLGAGPQATVATEDALGLALLVQRRDVRDAALFSMRGENAAQHLQLWSRVVRSVPESAAEMPLHLAGMAAWIMGEGAVVSIALDRSLAVADDRVGDRPSALLADLVDQVVPPTIWPSVRAELERRAAMPQPSIQDVLMWERVSSNTGHVRRPDPGRDAPPARGVSI